MAWLKIESAVARNRKFVKAGPGPSWLWICGLAYCQEGLTDGFIPLEAIDFLGVKSARNMARHLVEAGLWEWDEPAGGWRVHDYLDHNRTAAEVQAFRNHKIAAGSAGGRASGEARREALVKQSASTPTEAHAKNHPKHFPESVEAPGEPISVHISTDQISTATATDALTHNGFRLDVAFERLKALYPPNRVTSGHRTMTAFVDALARHGEAEQEQAFGRMLSNLGNQKRGHDWRAKGMIPSLEKWLRDGLWEQEHDPNPPPAEQLNARTNRTLTAAAEILRGEAS